MSKRISTVILEQLELPIITAPMFLVSSPKMVIAACKAGVVGSFPLLNARSSEVVDQWLMEIVSELEKTKINEPNRKIGPWAVNLIVHSSNKRYEEDLHLLKKYKPPIVITSLGDPSKVVALVHEYGGLVFSDVINLKFAKKAIQKGVDGLVLVSAGAGGHSGTINPFAFITAVREFWDGIIILAGSISKGNEIAAAQILGADLVFMGTRFIPAKESFASDDYRQVLVESSFEDVVYTDVFTGINANYLSKSIEKAGIDINQLDNKGFDFSKVKPWKDIYSAGHGVSSIKRTQTVSEIVAELKESYQGANGTFK